ncbi:MAG: hypothetical protein RLZZ476_1782, partial [Verrucomicrobiota bacterium]
MQSRICKDAKSCASADSVKCAHPVLTVSLILYNLLLPLGLLFMLPGALMKMTRRGGKWTDLLQRLGLHDDATR